MINKALLKQHCPSTDNFNSDNHVSNSMGKVWPNFIFLYTSGLLQFKKEKIAKNRFLIIQLYHLEEK